jgi:hypothetical protein
MNYTAKWLPAPSKDVKDGDYIKEVFSGRVGKHLSFGTDTGMSEILYLDGKTDISDWFDRAELCLCIRPRHHEGVWTPSGNGVFLKYWRKWWVGKKYAVVDVKGHELKFKSPDVWQVVAHISPAAVEYVQDGHKFKPEDLMFVFLKGATPDFIAKIKCPDGEYR